MCDRNPEKIFFDIYGRPPEMLFSAAGRVNLIGEHTDYCGGMALPAALSMRSRVYAAAGKAGKKGTVRIAATTTPLKAEIDPHNTAVCKKLSWGNYQAGVVEQLVGKGMEIKGCDLLYDIDLPFGAGLSSSAAIEVSTAYALSSLAGVKLSFAELASVGQKAENDFVGVKCGIMDQLASASGKKGYAMLTDFSDMSLKYVKFAETDCEFVILDTCKPRALIRSKYNERSEELLQAKQILSERFDVDFLARIPPDKLVEAESLLPEKLFRRVRHVVTETARTGLFASLMEKGDVVRMGVLMNESHESLKNDYEVTGFELDSIVSSANGSEFCLGARMTGAGFGGCAVCLIKKGSAEAFFAGVERKYREKTGLTPVMYPVVMSEGLTCENLSDKTE